MQSTGDVAAHPPQGRCVAECLDFANLCRRGDVPYRVLVSNAGSYLYLNQLRPALSCSPWDNSGAEHTCNDFVDPLDTDGMPTCNGEFNDYKYGLGDLGSVTSSYIAPIGEYT
eukprot:SAG31_NODE_11044_length_1072_cov_0.603289_3_plen_112_part_01